MMAQMILDLDMEKELLLEQTFNEPAIGSGVFFIAIKFLVHDKYGYNVSSRLNRNMFGQDINSRCVKMARIQLLMTNHTYMTNMLYVRAYQLQQDIKSGKSAEELCQNPECLKHPK